MSRLLLYCNCFFSSSLKKALEAQMEEARQRKLAKENKQKQAALPVIDLENADEEKPIDVEDTTVSDNEAEVVFSLQFLLPVKFY